MCLQAEGNFNLIRIWGGTLFEPRAFYDACDEFGILIYHDMQYNRDEGDLGNTTDQQAEIAHQMKRLSCVSISLVCGSCGVDLADRSFELLCSGTTLQSQCGTVAMRCTPRSSRTWT